MKTIQIPDEMYSKLIELAKEYVEQDNRLTAKPYLFQIRDTEEFPIAEGYGGEEIWIDTDGGELRTEEDIKEYIVQALIDDEGNFEEFPYATAKKRAEEKYDKMDELDIEAFLEEHEFHSIEVAKRTVYKNAFLTAKACKQHIKSNSYHYNEPVDYLNHSWRNPEMDLISDFLIIVNKQNKECQTCLDKDGHWNINECKCIEEVE